MKIFKCLFTLAFILLLAACPAPGHGRIPFKISALGETVWVSKSDAGTYLAIAFRGTHPQYHVGSSITNLLETSVQQATANITQNTTYDESKPGEINVTIDNKPRIFRPVSATEAELIPIGSSENKMLMKRYK